MAYSKFTLERALTELDLTLTEGVELFPNVAPVTPGAFLAAQLARGIPLAESIGTEKARSEFVLAPLLAEVRECSNGTISLFSGVEFNVDAERGLKGACDFLLARSPLQTILRAPAFAVVEAKSLNLNPGLGQCIAEMVGAQIFNERAGLPIDTIWGAVTTGLQWRFLSLRGANVSFDRAERALGDGSEILGILLHIAAPAGEV